ncbi:MAG: AMP-binding protein [Xanthobacteraceae bacterium]|jgi:acyl-CoA synthetase (AMP-forming)/AMP-acid ligase II/thiamine pyrophosphate-dependent acetolactate synthase large subunit-like protein
MPAEVSTIEPPTEAATAAARPWLRWYGKVPAQLAYPEVTLYEAVAHTAERVPDAVAWDFFDTTATYREFLASIDACANALAALGLKAGERIVVAMPTSPQAVIAFYAANKLGAVSAFVHPLSTAPEIERYLDATGARIALTLDALYDRFASIHPRVPLEVLILARIPDYLSPAKSLGFWLTKGRRIPAVPADPRVRWWAALMRDPQPLAPRSPATTYDPGAILFSGGTSGSPKGIVLSNRNFIAMALQVATFGEVHEGDSILAILPIFHGFGLGVCVNLMFMTGGKSILVPTFTAESTARLLRKKQPNLLVGVPTLYAALTRDKSLARADLVRLRAAFSGADRLPRQVKEQFESLVARRGGHVKLREGYGLTEAVTAIMAMPLDEYREGSIGVPFPDMLVKICSPETLEDLPPGQEGEICISGPNVMIGYLNDPEATSRTLRRHGDGRVWLHTGDLGRMDADGFFYFSDRLKRMIKSSGFNVFPAQVETVLYRHPQVLEACVVGVPDPAQGERVKAFVVLKQQARPGPDTERKLIALCRSQLIKWSCPREIEFRRELPKTRIGKIDYQALAAEHIAQHDARQPISHGGDRVAAALQAHGVKFVFTLCGGHISPILTGSKARGLRVIDVRDEATAVFAADAVARLTGVPGVAAVTAGPGVTNTLTALKNAQLAQSPVVVLGGAAPTALQGRGALQDIDQGPVVAPHVKLMRRVRRVRDLTPAMEEAFAVAREGVPGPAFVECPIDLLYDETSIRTWYREASGKGTSIPDRLLRFYLERHVARMFAGSGDTRPPRAREVAAPAAHGSHIDAAAARLAKAQRPLLVIGSQTLALVDDPSRIAAAVARLGIPVYLSGMARGLLGRDHPLQMHHQRRQALRQADCVVLAGVPCDFRLDYGRHVRRSSTLIAANRSPKDARLNRRPDIAAIGDAGNFLERVAAVSGSAAARRNDWIAELRARDCARETEIDEQAKAAGEHVNPIALLRAVDHAASDNALFVADGGDFVATASYIVRPRGPRSWLDPGVFGTLGVGAGFALGAALCRTDAEVWILYGDGACGWSLTEFDSFVRHGIPVIAVVGNDASWTQIAREQVKMLHDDIGTVLARTAYHEVAAGFGAEGIVVKTTAEVPDALRHARAAAKAGKPVLVNVWLSHSDFREGSISM